MKVKELIDILQDCNQEDELTFIFDKNNAWNRGNDLYEVSYIAVTGYKINGKIPLTNGMSSLLVDKENAELIYK